LRPAGAPVANAAKSSTGVPGWMNHFSNVCNTIGQAGRRGALMLTLDVKHPDAEGFSKAKQDLTYCTGANVSLKITDEFMKAVKSGKKFKQQYPVDSDNPTIEQEVDAKELWKTICECAHASAEPGLIMWDNAISNLPAEEYDQFKSVSTNPCSEIILSENDACRLTTICLEGYVRNKFKDDCYFDFKSFEQDVRIAMHIMDALVSTEIQQIHKILDKVMDFESNEYKLWKKIQDTAINGRRCGLGTHGLGDALCQLNLRYDSEDALKTIDKIYKTMMVCAYDESIEMAKEAGAFPIFDYEKEKNNKFIKRLPKVAYSKTTKSSAE
jgi:ribonucleoside-diphosphate reductase alpha chain